MCIDFMSRVAMHCSLFMSTPVGRFELGKLRPSRRDYHRKEILIEGWEQERLGLIVRPGLTYNYTPY
jgi:hypothetical protein